MSRDVFSPVDDVVVSERQVSEAMVRLAQALVEDASLRAWFFGLEELPASRRGAVFKRMAGRMISGREDAELVATVSALGREELYQAICRGAIKAGQRAVKPGQCAIKVGLRMFCGTGA